METLGQKWPNLAVENHIYIFSKSRILSYFCFICIYLFEIYDFVLCFLFNIFFFHLIYLDWFEYIERLKLFCKTFLFQYYMFNMQIEKKKILSRLNYSSGIFLIFNSNNSYGMKTTTRSQTYIDFLIIIPILIFNFILFLITHRDKSFFNTLTLFVTFLFIFFHLCEIFIVQIFHIHNA